ncbi:SCO family protein [Wenzhouxiangella sp. XN201]|uniref:SCO family protein n=1 Tax=Wenzhouxiangella sp. XN201 TaxID=2710755 RepID=UPI0013C8DF98|nr:SCO family protein [Wenzhouxiangella sp. XN201]NEZ02665.1 SCO family protein [Wenzhouxiangella sp. XN201]
MMVRHGKRAATLIGLMAVTLAAGLLVGRTPPASTAWGQAPPDVRAVMWPEPMPLADVPLKTQHGRAFGQKDLEGQWSLMFFGYLDCPDVCPTSLHAMREMRRLLVENQGEEPQYLFVSVDPENDDPSEMADYLAWYDPNLIGLHGPDSSIRTLADSMAVKFEPFVDDAGNRSIDHTSSVMIIDPQGRMVGALPAPLVPQRMVEQFDGLRGWLESRS